MSSSYREQTRRERRRAHGDIRQALDHRRQIESSIEAVLEFSEIAAGVFGADRVVGATQTVLEIAEHGVDPFEGR